MIVISQAFALTLSESFAANLPVIGWDNLVTISNVEADGEASGFPATNLANPSTILGWRGANTSTQYLTVETGRASPIDYLAIARHNFGTGLVTVSIEGLSPDDGATWEELVEEVILPSDAPVLFRFEPTILAEIRVKLQPASVVPQAAVLYVGKLLVMQRGVQVHTPITMGRRRQVETGRSQSGDFLGRIITTASLATTADIQYLTPEWYRANMDAFADASAGVPFFFAWDPEDHPDEVGFAWLVNDLVPQTSHLVGYINVTLDMEALAL